MMVTRFITTVLVLLLSGAAGLGKQSEPRMVRLRDITTVEGVRDNPLVGYGLVVGLNGTGDRRQTLFPTQTLANVLQRMGVQIASQAVRVNNVAAVFVTANLPPFSRPGTKIDVTVSSTGDAKSLEGGLLLLTSLHGPDGQTYAMAQGPLTVGGYTAGIRGNSMQINHPTTGRVIGGAIVEREVSLDLSQTKVIAFLLREPDFTTAHEVAATINQEVAPSRAVAVDSRRVEIQLSGVGEQNIPGLLAHLENLRVGYHPKAKVVVNERTGTVVMGNEVTLGACSILHGNLAIEISTEFQVSQPAPLGRGQTVVVPQTTVQARDAVARRVELPEGATVDVLIRGLQAIAATARDIIAVLEALKAAGSLQAELEVI